MVVVRICFRFTEMYARVYNTLSNAVYICVCIYNDARQVHVPTGTQTTWYTVVFQIV